MSLPAETRSLSWWPRAAIVLALCLLAACGVEDAGLARNVYDEDTGAVERGRGVGSYGVGRADVLGSDVAPNNAPWVYSLSYDRLAMTPDGGTLLIGLPVPGPNKGYAKPGLELAAWTLATGKTKLLGVRDVVRINFAASGAVGWLLVPSANGGTGVWQMDVATLKISLLTTLPQRYTSLDVSPAGNLLVIANVPDTAEKWTNKPCQWTVSRAGQEMKVNACSYVTLDLDTMAAQTFKTAQAVRDLDFVPNSNEFMVSWAASNPDSGAQPTTEVRFQIHTTQGPDTIAAEVSVPNCAGELMLAPKYGLALLAPMGCGVDPISVIDLKTRKFIKNLPGFGPVAVLNDMAVGFAAHQAMGEPQPGMALVKVDLATLATSTIDVGSSPPKYAPTPDGKSLIVWNSWAGLGVPSQPRTVRLSDGLTEPFDNWTVVPGPMVWLPDGTAATLSWGLLFRLDPKTHTIQNLPLAGYEPELLRSVGSGTELLLGEADRPKVYRYTVATASLTSHDLTSPGVQIEPAGGDFMSQPHYGWAQVNVAPIAPSGLPACGTATSAVIAYVAVEALEPGTEKWHKLSGAWQFDRDAPCYLPEPGNAHSVQTMPVELFGQTLTARPTSYNIKTLLDFWNPIQPGMRIAVVRAVDHNGTPCQDNAPCAQVPLRLTLAPPWYPMAKPGILKDLGVFTGKGSFTVTIPPL